MVEFCIEKSSCAQFEVAVKPHIHVDSAIGWPLLFFLDYDFQKNPLRINADERANNNSTRAGIRITAPAPIIAAARPA